MYEENSFTGRLNALYFDSRLSMDDFAKRCNVSRSAMQNYLSGDRTPDSKRLIDFCQAFNVSADWLLGLDDVREKSADLKSAVKYSGLSEETIKKIASYPDKLKEAFSKLISSNDFWYLLKDLDMYLTVLYGIEGDEDAYEEYPELERKVSIDEDKFLKIPFEQSLQLLAGAVGKDMNRICDEIEYQRYKEQEQLYHDMQKNDTKNK